MTLLTITDSLKQRVADERVSKGVPETRLRVMVDSGGCAGFQYAFSWDVEMARAEDTVYDDVLLVDSVSLPYLAGATVDFVKTLMGEDFNVINPNATAGCGCGNSFAV